MKETRNHVQWTHGLTQSLLVAGLLLGSPAVGQELPERFEAVAIVTGNIATGRTARLEIIVERWSDDEERAVLFEALKAAGKRSLPEALLKREPVGRIMERGKLGETLRYSRQVSRDDGGRTIVLALDRPLGFVESWYSARTTDYNVTLVRLDLDEDGKGQGALMAGAELAWDEANQQITITNYSSEPVRLTKVNKRK